MQVIRNIQIVENSNEELLPNFSLDFPHISSCAELDKYIGSYVPWHWHRTVELFYIESGTLEYITPNGNVIFTAGSGGFINSNVLHSSKVLKSEKQTVQLLHLFETELLSGGKQNQMDIKYIQPITATHEIEIISLSPEVPQQEIILKKIRDSFELDKNVWGYEFILREKLTEIWLMLFEMVRSKIESQSLKNTSDEKMKSLMRYIHKHYSETISIEDLTTEVHISKRVCFRLFRENLHMSPIEYITSYRLNKARQRLIGTNETITQIAYNCGFGSSSYFGKVFREYFDDTPANYRKYWHNRDMK